MVRLGYIWLGFSLVRLVILVWLAAKDGADADLFTKQTDDVLSGYTLCNYNYYVLGYLNTNQTLKLINIPQIIIAKPKKT